MNEAGRVSAHAAFLKLSSGQLPFPGSMVHRNTKYLHFFPYNSRVLQCSNSPQSNYFRFTTYLETFMLTAEQIMASHKANIETLFGLTDRKSTRLNSSHSS